MNCEQFKKSYQKFDGATQNVIHWRDVETSEYASYSDHMQDCAACRDWFQQEQLVVWKVDPAKFPCVHMAYHASYRCASHGEDPWDCPSTLVVYLEQYDEYGLPIRDGSDAYWKIDNCPWCGCSLPSSRREQWLRKLKALGFDPFKDYERIPMAFKSARWYREGGNPDLRLV
jgi:hypothetical protein